eukprot:s9241_g4.t1
MPLGRSCGQRQGHLLHASGQGKTKVAASWLPQPSVRPPRVRNDEWARNADPIVVQRVRWRCRGAPTIRHVKAANKAISEFQRTAKTYLRVLLIAMDDGIS